MRRAASYDFVSMKPALALICAFLLFSAVHAQTPSSYLSLQNPIAPPGPVPISEEPHHRLVLQNDFTKVYNVMVSPLDATLLHQHDHPYLYVTLGPAGRQTRTPPDSARWRNALFARKLRAHRAHRFRHALPQHHHRTPPSAGHCKESLQGSVTRAAHRVPATAGRCRHREREREREEGTARIRGR